MLLRQFPAMEQDLFSSLGGASAVPGLPDSSHETPVDLLDDVWGAASAPGSPDLGPRGGSQEHPSDMRRLQQEHSTAGYREGITQAKASSIQDGFDEGFGLGATVGARAGQLLGILEGIATALRPREDEASKAAQTLFIDGKKDLSVQTVFSAEYWNADGTWKYEVPDVSDGEGGAVFSDVAFAHPLIKKWNAVVNTEVERWRLDLKVLANEHEEARREPELRQREIKVAPQSREALAW